MEEPPFEVEHFVPNVMTSFTVSLDKKFQVISFSKMVKSASKTHQNALNNVSDIGSAVTAAPLLGGIHNEDGLKKVATFMPPPDMHRSNRRFDDLISKLEKRYCSQGAYANESDEDDNGDSSDMRGRQDLSGSDMEVEGDDNAVPKKKKRAFQDAGDFDYDDPFIDDTDDLFLSTMMTKKTKTKHGGFFISSGVLEVTQKNKKGSLDGSGKSSAGSKTSTGGSKDKSKQQPKKKVVVVGSVINTSIPKPVISSVLPISPTKAASSSSSSSSAAKSFAKPKQAEASNSMASSGFGDSFDSSIVPDGSAKRVAKPKVEWQPKDIIINAMGTFETLVSDIKKDNSIKKFSPDGSDFTDSVDDCLIRLDDMVRACNSEVWSDSRAPSGYFERVSEILYNGESAPIRMKKIIKSIRSKNAARVLYVAMTDSIKALKLDIVANTSSYTPPPPKAATGADGAASPNKDNNQDASMLPGDAEDIADFDLGKSADATAAAKTPKAPVEYKFIVKWKPSMKTLAADIEEMLLNYIREENAYRACLSSSTKSGMEAEDTDTLVEKTEIQKVFANISIAFPAQCKDGDAAALRRIISMEKTRRKKEQKKEVEKKLELMSATSGSVGGILSPPAPSTLPKTSTQAAVLPKAKKEAKEKKEPKIASELAAHKEKKERAPPTSKLPVSKPPVLPTPATAVVPEPFASSGKDTSMQSYTAGQEILPGDPVWGCSFGAAPAFRHEDFVTAPL